MTSGSDISDVFDLLDDCVIVRDLEGRITAWNRAAEDVYGIPRESAIGVSMDALFGSQESRAGLLVEEKGQINRVVRGRSGTVAVSVTSKPIRDTQGNPMAMVEMSRPVTPTEKLDQSGDIVRLLAAAGLIVLELDATEAFRTLAALRSHVANTRDYLLQDSDLVYRLMHSTPVEVAPGAAGETAANFLSELNAGALTTFWPEQSAHAFIDAIVAVLVDEVPANVSCKLLRWDGGTFEAEITVLRASAARDDVRLLLAIKDVSAAREAYETLEASELRYRHLFEYMPIALTQVDASGLVEIFTQLRRQGVEDLSTYIDEHPEFLDLAMEVMRVEQVNQTSLDLFGAKSGEEMRGSITQYFRDTGRQTLRKSLEARYRGQDFFQQEARLRRLDDSVVDVLFAASRHSSLPDKSLVAFMDISDRKRAEEALRRSERRYQDLFQHLPVPVMQVNSTGLLKHLQDLRSEGVDDLKAHMLENPHFIWTAMEGTVIEQANNAALKVLGVTDLGDLLGPITPLWRNHPDVYERLLRNRYFELTAFEEEVTLTTFDGQTREGILTVTFPPALAKHGVTINAFVDTTEKKNAERRLRSIEAEYAHAARISMLGELTASIAHEVNQPLAAITTYGEAGLRWLNRPDPELSEVRDIVTRIVADAQRAAGVIARVRKMASHRKHEEEFVSLNELIAEALQFLGHEFRLHNVKVMHVPEIGDMLVRVDRIQLQQVIVNLAVNAVQAISMANSSRREVIVRTAVEGAQVRCSVEDSGPGIPQEAMNRIFQSFFTTKDGGMGMGLPISRSIIEAHGGRMVADNDGSCGGARFTFVLPKAL